MKRFAMLLAAGIAALVLSACGSTGTVIAIPTPAQLATDVCPPTKVALAAVQVAGVLPAAQQSTLTNKVIPGANAVCAAGATINVTDLQAFNATAFPVLISLVNASTLPAATKIEIGGGLTLAQPILAAIVSSMPPATATTAASVPAATPSIAASAPAAVSQ